MAWSVTLTVPEGDGPTFLRLAEAVVAEIQRGRLRPGDALPGTRKVATQLGVHRNTVVAAWRELRAQGWLETRQGAATRIASLPAPPPRHTTPRSTALDIQPMAMPRTTEPVAPGVLDLAGGKPDLRLVPIHDIARAWASALRHTRGKLLAYGDPRGHPRLRQALSAMLAARRGLVTDPDHIVITRGSQQAMYLLGRALLRPGDRVAVEELGYPLAWAALRASGAELVSITVDSEGLRVDQVEDAAKGGLRAVYVTPHHQYPTMATLGASRRMELLRLAAEYRFAILEDDYDNEFHFAGQPVLPLAARDTHGVVAYLGTLSKTLAPGLRLGFVTGPTALTDAVAAIRVEVDRQGDLATEYALATLIEDGTVPRHLRRMRRVYHERQRHFSRALRAALGERVAFEVPAGGLALWVRTLLADPADWSSRALARGAAFEVGRSLALRGQALPYARMGFASLDLSELDRAVEILAETHP
ncbi:MAG: PLP-dependent aminotransferase family protein [Myxococcales bacterium]|nr:PLP-dependent aminotransferase family protein [Myxococcales bacterium]